MKLIRLTRNGAVTATTKPVLINGKPHHVLSNGRYAVGYHDYTIAVSDHITDPENVKTPLTLNETNYKLIPVIDKSTNEQKKDRNGNFIYFIGYNFDGSAEESLLVLWSIPNISYIDVQYSVTGECTIIGEGISGNVRDGVEYKSPAPVLEVHGRTVLRWNATKDVDGGMVKISQTITIHSDLTITIDDVVQES